MNLFVKQKQTHRHKEKKKNKFVVTKGKEKNQGEIKSMGLTDTYYYI